MKNGHVVPVRVLRVLKETGTIFAAAQRLGHSPSHLSQVLREHLGVTFRSQPYDPANPARGRRRREVYARGFAATFGVDICPERPYAEADAMPLGLF